MTMNTIELILGLDINPAMKQGLLTRFKKIRTDKVLVQGDDVTLVPKYNKEYIKGIDGRYYVQKTFSQRWLSLDTRYNFKQVIVLG